MKVTAPRSPGRRPAPSGAGDPSSVYVRSLVRSQLRAAGLAVAGFALPLAGAAALLAFVPELRLATVAGVPIGWLVLGLAVYPLILLVAVVFVRVVDRNERHYRSLAADDHPAVEP